MGLRPPGNVIHSEERDGGSGRKGFKPFPNCVGLPAARPQSAAMAAAAEAISHRFQLVQTVFRSHLSFCVAAKWHRELRARRAFDVSQVIDRAGKYRCRHCCPILCAHSAIAVANSDWPPPGPLLQSVRSAQWANQSANLGVYGRWCAHHAAPKMPV